MNPESKYLKVVKQVKAVEKRHRRCKYERLTRAILELERVLENPELTLSSTAKWYIQDRINNLKQRKKDISHDVRRRDRNQSNGD